MPAHTTTRLLGRILGWRIACALHVLTGKPTMYRWHQRSRTVDTDINQGGLAVNCTFGIDTDPVNQDVIY